jgi:hypothetical protein
MVKCRTQEDIDNNIELSMLIKKKKVLFRKIKNFFR